MSALARRGAARQRRDLRFVAAELYARGVRAYDMEVDFSSLSGSRRPLTHMALELKQSHSMKQKLGVTMTQQLQQAIKLLQLSRLELVDRIEQEMVENPLLEEAQEEAVPREELRHDGLASPDAMQSSEPSKDSADEDASADGDEDNAPVDPTMEIDWERYLENYTAPLPAAGGAGGRDDLPDYHLNMVAETTLSDHLLSQLGVIEASDEQRRLAEYIIGNLDEDGLLRVATLAELADELDFDEDDLLFGLELVQSLEPTGVGARSIAECLMLQAKALWPDDPIPAQVVSKHLTDLERRDYGAIGRGLGISRQQARDAHRKIMTLAPHPAGQFAPARSEYITPDIYIIHQDGKWVAQLNDDGLPRLRISNYYRNALRKSADAGARGYVRERLNSARWLIRSIEQRQRTILKVTNAIIDQQRDFFEHGIAHLKPLVLADIAAQIEMHESTVSRVTSNKYVHTPRGIFELKFFFNAAIRTSQGDDLGAEAVRHRIKALIDSEPPKRPLSDQKLVNLLREDGIEIARRTVAKYRESMGLLSSSRRKRVV